jgi:glycosyltransferase involved in cell wall biosynthesis
MTRTLVDRSVAASAETPPRSGRRPRLLYVGSSDFNLPLSPGLAAKWGSIADRVDLRVIARAGRVEADDPRFRLVQVPDRLMGAFHLALPWVVAREVRQFRPDVVVTQSPYEALPILAIRRALPTHPKLIVEIHGDWESASRFYGSRLRRLFAAASDRAAVVALRRADGFRAISEFTAGLAEEATNRKPLSTFPTYSDLESFLADPVQPLPSTPTIAWIGMLQRVKDPDAFAEAWRLVAERVPDARAIVVGDGPLRSVIDDLCAEFPERVQAFPRIPPSEVAGVLDRSTVLVLPSRSEGLGRVAVEAFSRGRPVVGSAVGGIQDIVTQERSGLLVPAGDATALADALVRVLSDTALAQRLADGALADAGELQWRLDEYADAVREMVDRAIELP